MKKELLKTNATAFYIEDEDNWLCEIQDFIKIEGIEFDDFITSTTLETIEPHMASTQGPVIIIIDLMFGEETRHFTGYHWVLEELAGFKERKAGTSVFVISGQLSDGIVDTLIRNGIPQNHIFSKGQWVEQRHDFSAILREDVQGMDSISIENIQTGASGKIIDPYILHWFQLHDESIDIQNEYELNENVTLPVLIRAKSRDWNWQRIPDLKYMCHR